MKETTFTTLCAALQKGEDRFVENTRNHHAGKAVSCQGDQIEVDIYGKHESWSRKESQEFEKPDFDYHR
jgi:hypothetical protein